MNWKNLGLLLLLATLWGPSFLFIKVAVQDILPLSLALGRVAIGAIVLLGVLRWHKKSLPRDRGVWKALAIVALLHNALPFVLFGWGEQYIDSALASILNGTTPLFTIILAHFLVAGDRLTPTKIGGVLVGFVGLLGLTLPTLQDGVQGTTLGILAVAAASASYGLAIIYTRNNLRGLPPLVAPASQLSLATLYLFPLAMLFDKPWQLPQPSSAALASLLALGIMGTGLAFIVYYRLLETAEPTYISMVTYVIPIFGVLLGVLVLGEQLSWYSLAGFILILLGVMIVNGLLTAFGPWLSRSGQSAN
jgi:drug/metabolite transporter (DMT)-like permease